MKHILLIAVLLPSLLIAQLPTPPQQQPLRGRTFSPGSPLPAGNTAPAGFPDNYELALTLTEKEAQPLEVSVVLAATQFNVSLGEHNLAFSGNVNIDDSGSVLIGYTLSWQTIRYPVREFDSRERPPQAG